VKKFLAHLVFLGALSVESTAQEMIDLDHTTCRQFLGMKPGQILIVMGWLQGYYLDDHALLLVDFDKASSDSRKLMERCQARPDEDLMTAAQMLFAK
jgi:hypothetical protein